MTRSTIIRGLVPLLLFGSWPYIAFLATNQGRGFQYQDVVVAWAATVTIAVLCGAAIAIAFRSVSFERAGLLVGVLSAIFFSFGSISQLLGLVGVHLGTVWLLVWAVIFVGAGWLVWVGSRYPAVRPVLVAAAATMAAIPTIEIGYGLLREMQTSSAVSSQASKFAVADDVRPRDSKSPNVYWFLLDGYVRSDSLAKYFSYDNEPFLSSLENREFTIARSAYANYDNTTSSLGTTLTMDYFYSPGQQKPDTRSYTRILSGFNNVVRTFQRLGYRYIHAPYAGSSKTQCSGIEDRCIRAKRTDGTPLSDVQVSILQLTPIYRIIRTVFRGAFTYDHIFIEDIEPQIRYQTTSPYFLFAHILSPHAPPRYTRRCERIADIAPSINVGEGIYDPDQFRTDTRCTNESVILAIDRILQSDASNPIIVIQGDHGFEFRLPGEEGARWDIAKNRSLQERRLAILNALRLPEKCRDHFYPDISPVNTFRFVFACLENRTPDLVPDRHFFRAKDGDGHRLIEMRILN